MAKKTQFLIVHGASVVVVRDGKRVSLAPGQGADFTEEEISAVNKALPGSLRKPVNEGTGRKAEADDATDSDEDDADDDADADEAKAETPKQKKARLAAEKKAAADKKAAGDSDDDEDI